MNKNLLLKKMLYSILCILTSFLLCGQEKISLDNALKIAENIVQTTYKDSKISTPKLNLAYISTKNASGTNKSLSNENEIYYYVFNINENDGFIAVSGNDIAVPILTYCNEGNYDVKNLPPALTWWMEQYKKEIQYAIDNKFKQTSETKNMWLNIEKKIDINPLSVDALASKTYVEGTNLVKSTWGQRTPFNNLVNSKLGGNYATGCTATAMAQVMYYWKHPSKVSTTIPGYTTETLKLNVPSIDNGTSINWGNIIDSYSNKTYNSIQADAVAQLMYYVGASVQMNYNSSSGAWPSVDALKKYFGYDASAKVERRHKNKDTWDSILKLQIDSLQPIVYVGGDDDQKNYHAFVCDGYKYQNGSLYFHFNWGWGGSKDNYCVTSALKPDGASYDYSRNNTYERIYINIKPATSSTCSAPTNLVTSNISTKNAILKWNAVSGAQNYTVEYKLAAATNWTVAAASTTETTFTLSGLSADTSYLWMVKTNCSTSDNSIYIQTNFTTPAICHAPTGLTTSNISTNSAIIKWNAVSGAQNYTVEYKLATAKSWTVAATSTTATSFTLSGLNTNTAYIWRVKTNCSEFNISEYAQNRFTTSSICLTPTNLSVTNLSRADWNSPSYATLRWKAVDKAQNYIIEFTHDLVGKWIVLNSTTNSVFLTLQPDATIHWRVKTICSPYNSSEYAQSQFRVPPRRFFKSNEIFPLKKNSSTDDLPSISVYPNPVENTIYIEGLNSYNEEYSLLTITDRNGKIVKTINTKIDNIISVDVSDLSPNIYYIIISGKSYKFIKS